jgi:PSP
MSNIGKGIVPGQLSEELRKALGLEEGAPPPWQGRLHAFGVPFDYRTDVARLRSPERFVDVRTLPSGS